MTPSPGEALAPVDERDKLAGADVTFETGRDYGGADPLAPIFHVST